MNNLIEAAKQAERVLEFAGLVGAARDLRQSIAQAEHAEDAKSQGHFEQLDPESERLLRENAYSEPPQLKAKHKPACKGCNGHGMVGNVIDSDICPFCKGSGIESNTEQQEPFVWACTECGTELEDDDTRKYCNSCGYNKFYKSPRILRQEPVSQEPVAYLCDGARYKIMGEDRSGFGRILGLPESLAGQWVALVDATDGKHLRAEPARTKDLTDEIDRLCAAIKAEDDYCVDNGDYMLDSNDCIKIIRGEWVRPDYSLDRAVIAADRKLNGVEK